MRYIFCLLIFICAFTRIYAASNELDWFLINSDLISSSQATIDERCTSGDETSEFYLSQSSLDSENTTQVIQFDSEDIYKTPSKLKKRKNSPFSLSRNEKENLSPNVQDAETLPSTKRPRLIEEQSGFEESTPSTPKTPSRISRTKPYEADNLGTPYTPNTLSVFEKNGMDQTKRAVARVLSSFQYGVDGSPYSSGILKGKASEIAEKPITDDNEALEIVFVQQIKQSQKGIKRFREDPTIKARAPKRGEITAEALSAVGVKRSAKNSLLKLNIIKKTTAKDYIEPYIPESPTKIAERKKTLQRIYLEQESKRGLSPENLTETYSFEKNIWSSYFAILENYKLLVEQKIEPKLTKIALESMFDEFIASAYSHLSFGQFYKVFFEPSLIDLERTDRQGRSNLSLLSNGLCPIGHDGKHMHFHHFSLHDYATHGASYGYSYVVLVSHKFHEELSGSLHPTKDYYSSVPSKRVDRNLWGQQRKQICIKLYEILTSS